MRFKPLFFLCFALISGFSFSQVKVGQWVDHTCHTFANAVAKLGTFVYSSNGVSLTKYNILDNSLEKMTKYEGLSDVGIKLMRKSDHSSLILVIYENTNIDVIKADGSIVNVSDIKRKSIPGKKFINEVYFNGKFAYISAGFGIVVFDTEKLEIKETYYIGNGITNYEVYQVTKNDTAFFAATNVGVFYGKATMNLSNFQNWKSLNTGIAPGPYNNIVNFGGKILANYSARLDSDQSMKDTIYQYNGTSWSVYLSGTENKKIYDYSKYNKLLIIDQWGLKDRDLAGNGTVYITKYNSPSDDSYIKDCYFENDGIYWLADERAGFVKSKGGYPEPNEKLNLNGPNTNLVNDLASIDGNVYMASTNLGELWNNQWRAPYINYYKDYDWTSLNSTYIDSIYDINCTAVDPNDKEHAVFGSWGKGVVEVRNGVPVNIYNKSNSSMQYAGTSQDVRVGGVFFDQNSNLWAISSLNNKFLNVKTPSGTWVNFDFNPIATADPNAIMSSNPNAGKVIVDKKGLVWVHLARGAGMVVFNPGSSFNQPNTLNAKIISTYKGSGGLPTSDIFSMVEDQTGNVWVGTGKGVAVFYNTDRIFSGGDWDCQQILIEQDNHVQILLENDEIRSLAVDGANRKWCGTLSSGLYCFSPDGQEEIYHFTTENSPLYSNVIRDISVDEKTGDVFIASDIGIQSYRTDIIKGFEDFTKVHAYPNPIRPGYSSNVYITGLIDEAVVKITDVAGNLVWQTKSQGGQVGWNLTSLSGSRVQSGVYMIHCASTDGEKSASTKLMVIN